jgi:preprotein translocase subunit SecG
MMKKRLVLVFFVVMLVFVGCSSEKEAKKVRLLGDEQVKPVVHPNGVLKQAEQKAQEHKNRVELSKIEANTKIELEKIRSQNELSIAQLNAQTQKEIVKEESKAKIETSQLEVAVKKESVKYGVYVAIGVIILFMLALYLLYLNAKKNRELKKQLHEEKLKHEQFLKEKELEEQRLHKLIELAADGKLPKNIESEVILSLSCSKNIINS